MFSKGCKKKDRYPEQMEDFFFFFSSEIEILAILNFKPFFDVVT